MIRRTHLTHPSTRLSLVRPILSVVGLALACSGAWAANTNETEGNDSKPAANAVAGMAPGDTITGNSTGVSTTVAGPTSADYFRVRTAGAALAIYQYRLTVSSETAGHTGTIRGLNQAAGVPTAGGDATFQTSMATSTPARFVQWYGFGKQEEIYYRVSGGTTTTSDYVASLDRTPVTPVDISGNIISGPITISTIGQSTSDTDFWVYDSNLDPVATFGNDDESIAGGGTGVTLQSRATRTLAAGTYYIAISNFNSANDQGSPADDDFRTGGVLDFPNAFANANTATGTDCDVVITSGAGDVFGTAVKNGPFDVVWYRFVVGSTGQLFGTATATPGIIYGPSGLPGAGNPSTSLLTVMVTPGQNPASTGITVTGNLGAIGGSATQMFFDNGTNGDVTAGDNVFSYAFSATGSTPVGAANLPITIGDAQGRTANSTASLTVRAGATVTDLGTINMESDGQRVLGAAQTAGAINWYKLTFACPVDAGAMGWLDMQTNGSSFDTEIGLFDSAGNLISSDDDGGEGFDSAMSFGSGSGLDLNGADAGGISAGANGATIAAGDYYLAVTGVNAAFNATGFGVTTTSVATGTYDLYLETNLTCGGAACDTIDFNNDGVFPSSEDITDFLVVFGGGACSNDPNCHDIDFNNDGVFPSSDDIDVFLRVFGGGSC